MMITNTIRRLLLLLTLLLGWGHISAQDNLQTLGFFLNSTKKTSFKTSFKLYNNLIVLPIAVGKIDTLNFVLDTGVGYTLITDPEVKNILNLECYRKIKVAGTGEERPLEACISNVDKVSFKSLSANNLGILILDQDVLQLSNYAGVRIHGLIGYDLFSRFVVSINYHKKRLTFTRPEYYKTKLRKKSEVFPIVIEDMKPYIQAEALLNNRNLRSLKLIIDTGAGHSLSLEQGSHPNIIVPEKNITSQIGMTLNGAVRGSLARIEKLKLGSFELERVITAFPDTNSLKFVKGIIQRQGNLGCGILKRFHLTFDYFRNQLILTPNKEFKEPFQFNTSGIELKATGEDFKSYEVGEIRKDSPADWSGLKRGDVIIAIDGEGLRQYSMEEVYYQINKKNGETTSLFLKRKNHFFLVELKLKEPF